MKLSRRAGKRPDEILEDDEPVHHRHDQLRHLQQQHLQQHGGPQSASTPGRLRVPLKHVTFGWILYKSAAKFCFNLK